MTGFEIDDLAIKAVQTERGTIKADQVLICGGIWGPLLGKMADVPIPLPLSPGSPAAPSQRNHSGVIRITRCTSCSGTTAMWSAPTATNR